MSYSASRRCCSAQSNSLSVGQTIRLNTTPDDPLEVHCGGIPLGRAQIGQRRNNVAVRMVSDLSKGFNP